MDDCSDSCGDRSLDFTGSETVLFGQRDLDSLFSKPTKVELCHISQRSDVSSLAIIVVSGNVQKIDVNGMVD